MADNNSNLPAQSGSNYPKFDPKAAASGNNTPVVRPNSQPSTQVHQPKQPQQPQQPQNPPNTAQAANVNATQPHNVLYNLDEYRKIENAVGFYTNTQNRIDEHLAYHNEIHQKWRGIRRTGIKAGILGGAWGVMGATGLWGAGQTFVGAMIAGSPVGMGLLALTAGIWAYGKYAKHKNEAHNRKMGVNDKRGNYTQGSYGDQLEQQKTEILKKYHDKEPVQIDWTQSKGLLDTVHDEMSTKRKNNVAWKKAGNIGVATGVFGTIQMLLGAHVLPGGGPALAAMGIVADAVTRLTMNRSILTFDEARPKEDRTGLYIGVPYMKSSAGSLSGGIRLFGKDNIDHPKEKSRLDLFQENIDFHDDQAKRNVLFETTFEPKPNSKKPPGVSHTVYPT